MPEIPTVGRDLAKNVPQWLRADAGGRAVLRRRQVLDVLAVLPRRRMAMAACAGAQPPCSGRARC